MNSAFRTLFTIYSWTIIIVGFSLHFVVAFVYSLMFRDRAYAHLRASQPFIKMGFWLIGIKMKVSGLDLFPRDRAVMIISNHQSLLDILVYVSLIPVKFSFIAKKELMSAPIIGTDIKMQKHITIDRQNGRQAMETLGGLNAFLAQGRSILGFAEGTRSSDETVLPFKRGLFSVALEAGVPIVPCYISGTNKINKKNQLAVTPGTVTVVFGEPIYPAEAQVGVMSKKQLAASLMDQTRNAILALRNSTI